MLRSNPPGRPSDLTPEAKARVLDAIPKVIVQTQVANKARVSQHCLSRWLIRGKVDKEKGINSDYVQFRDDYMHTLALVLEEILLKIRSAPRNYGALTWLVEKCFREEFGKESEDMRELMEKFAVVLGIKGMEHGRKMDTESATQGIEGEVAQGIENTPRPEDPTIQVNEGPAIA